VVTDQPDLFWLMITNNTWSSMSQTSDSESWPFFPREIQRESLKSNLKERLRNQEVPKREKYWLLEKSKRKAMSEKPRKITLKSSSLFDCDLCSLFNFLSLFISFLKTMKNVCENLSVFTSLYFVHSAMKILITAV
jgi:hypothetical protein